MEAGERTPPITPLLVSVKQAAVMLGVSERTLRRMVADREIESVKVAERRMIPLRAIEVFAQPEQEAAGAR